MRRYALRHLLRRLGGRLARWCRGVLGRDGADRTPVRELTEADFRHLDHLYAAGVSLIAMSATAFVFIIFSVRPTCG